MNMKKFTRLIVLLALVAVLCMPGMASAELVMNVTFDSDTIGSAPLTGASGSPITQIGALGGYTATAYSSPPTAAMGTILVDNVAGMSKAAVLTTNSTNGAIGALFMDTGLSMVSSQLGVKFDIGVLAAPTAATAQAPYYLNGTTDTAGVLFGVRAYANTVGAWAFSFAVAPTSETGGVFALRDITNTQLTTFGSYVEGQKYNIALSADYSLGTLNAYVDGVLGYSGYPLRTGAVGGPTSTSELFIYFNGESGSANQVAIDNIQVYNTAAPVPVPAAVWLLGTGLVGLIGIRRRFVAS
jgi:hypothetical protein